MSIAKTTALRYIKKDIKLGQRISNDFKCNKMLYLMVLPVVVFYIIFHYVPMFGVIISFKEYSPMLGIIGSPWIGFKNFIDFFESYYCWRIIKNTIVVSLTSLVFGFPAPIILALLINELRNKRFTRLVQTVTYMPHFISLVVICGMIRDFTSNTGIVTYIYGLFGGENASLLTKPNLFVPIYVVSGIWQEVGWGSILYLAALAGINNELYEAAKIDGANRWQQTVHVTIPGIIPTIIILLILRIGSIMNVGYEKIILLYNPGIYETADIISSFVYRKGLGEFNFSFGAAVGLFTSVINFIFLVSANWLSKRFNDTSLW